MYWILLIICLLTWFLTREKRYRWIYILYKTLPRDIKGGYRFLKVNYKIQQWDRNQDTVPKIFTKLVRKHPNKVLFFFENEAWTYQQLEDFSNKIANYFKDCGFEKGDTISLLLENRPEYVGVWLGLSKIGVITALINTNLVSSPLHHSISVANSMAIIYGSNYKNAIDSIKENLRTLKLYEFNTSEMKDILDGSLDLQKELECQSTICPEKHIGSTTPRDKIVYIYTSGTTGLPKAAVISHSRFIFTATGVHYMTDLNENDIYYNPLPLYHSAGGMVGVGQGIMFGITVVLRRKFSASNFWNDCKKYKCTVAHYIGEICRYVLAAHNKDTKIDHSVKKMLGNGLRPQIWKQFVDTFKIEHIYELYGSTEGNSNLINIDNTIGAVGFVPRYAYKLYPVTLIKCSQETNEPIRNRNGFCIRCKPGEHGILIGKINQKKSVSQFTGYADKSANSKKVIRDVFIHGDTYFNSGDILIHDEFGYYFFKDRTGDTFRWKGENVATNEVEAVVSNVIGLKDTVVYGVEIPGTEGRAGMVAIVDPGKAFSRDDLGKGLKAHLPSYAIPLFLRVMETVPMTGTFKVRKVDLQKEGFDINIIKDPLYFFDAKNSTYIQLDSTIYENILSGRLKL